MAKADRIVIKKYSNRRLYDTERSLYINLEEVAVLLKAGRDVEVQDAKTGQDLTRTILLQLVLEREKNNIDTLPVELLKELIVIQDTPARKWFDLSMKYSLELLRRFKKGGAGMASPWDASLFNPADIFTTFMRDMRIPGFGFGAEPPVGGSSRADVGREAPPTDFGAEAPPTDLKSELDALRAKLESIEASIGKDEDA
jgi:polyhydroxyalkanoate synthesis repressor PhaR